MRSLPKNLCDYSEEDAEYCIQYLMDNNSVDELWKRIDVIHSQRGPARKQGNEVALDNLRLMESQHRVAIFRKKSQDAN